MTSRTERKQRAHRFGERAERWCAFALTLKGYRVIARRAKVAGVEIDLIAVRGRTLAFVEVKARQDAASALDAVDAAKRARLARGASAFAAGSSQYAHHALRFDVMTVRPRRWPFHLPDAWRP